jgi:hypothetical protein
MEHGQERIANWSLLARERSAAKYTGHNKAWYLIVTRPAERSSWLCLSSFLAVGMQVNSVVTGERSVMHSSTASTRGPPVGPGRVVTREQANKEKCVQTFSHGGTACLAHQADISRNKLKNSA